MADTKISALTSAAIPLAGTEVLPIVQSGTTVKVAVSDVTAGRTVAVGRLLFGSVTATGTNAGEGYLANGAALRWRNAANTGYLNTIYVDGSNNLQLGGGGATADTIMSVGGIGEVARVTSTGIALINGKGIDFSATPGTGTSELLDDYEEGTWTPLISDGTNNATNIPQVGGSYTKVGRLVTLTGTVATSSLGSVSGNIRLTGFPFATPTQFYAQSAGAVTGTSGLAILPGQSLSLLVDRTSAFAYIRINDAATGDSAMTATQWSADGGMTFSLSYVVE